MRIFGFVIMKASEYNNLEAMVEEGNKNKTLLEKCRSEFVREKEKMDRLEEEYSDAMITIDRKDKEIISSGKSLSEIQEKYEQASENNKKILSSLKDKTQELARTKNELKLAQSELELKNSMVDELQASLIKLQSEKDFLEGQVATLEKYIVPEDKGGIVPDSEGSDPSGVDAPQPEEATEEAPADDTRGEDDVETCHSEESEIEDPSPVQDEPNVEGTNLDGTVSEAAEPGESGQDSPVVSGGEPGAEASPSIVAKENARKRKKHKKNKQ